MFHMDVQRNRLFRRGWRTSSHWILYVAMREFDPVQEFSGTTYTLMEFRA